MPTPASNVPPPVTVEDVPTVTLAVVVLLVVPVVNPGGGGEAPPHPPFGGVSSPRLHPATRESPTTRMPMLFIECSLETCVLGYVPRKEAFERLRVLHAPSAVQNGFDPLVGDEPDEGHGDVEGVGDPF